MILFLFILFRFLNLLSFMPAVDITKTQERKKTVLFFRTLAVAAVALI